MAEMRQVDSDLVGPSGLETRLHQARRVSDPLSLLKVSDRRLGIRPFSNTTPPVASIPHQIIAHRQRPALRQGRSDERQVGARNLAGSERVFEMELRRLIERDQHEPGCVFVEAMYGERRSAKPLHLREHTRLALTPGRRHGQQVRRFPDHDIAGCPLDQHQIRTGSETRGILPQLHVLWFDFTNRQRRRNPSREHFPARQRSFRVGSALAHLDEPVDESHSGSIRGRNRRVFLDDEGADLG